MLNAESIKRTVINATHPWRSSPALATQFETGKTTFRASPEPHPAGATCQRRRLCETLFTWGATFLSWKTLRSLRTTAGGERHR